MTIEKNEIEEKKNDQLNGVEKIEEETENTQEPIVEEEKKEKEETATENKIIEEKKTETPQLEFLNSFIHQDIVSRFPKNPKPDDFFKISLYISLNTLISLPTISHQRDYLANVRRLLETADDLSYDNKMTFLRILEDRICWEYTQAIELLDAKLLSLEEAQWALRLFFELKLFFDVENFSNTLNMRILVRLLKFDRFEYLFEPKRDETASSKFGLQNPSIFYFFVLL